MLGHLILGLIVDPRPGETRRRVWRVLVTASLTLLGVAALAAAVWLLVRTADYGWQTLDWDRMQAAEIVPLYSLFLLVFPTLYLVVQPLVPRRVQRNLLALLEAEDTRWATLARSQPATFTPDELAQLGTEDPQLAPLRVVAGSYNSSDINPLFFCLGLVVEQSVLVLSEVTRALGVEPPCCVFTYTHPDLVFLIIFGGLGIFFIGIVGPAYIASLRRLRVTADERGLVWRNGGRWAPQRRAEWSGMRSFWRAPHAIYPSASVTYMLDTGSGVIGWTLSAASKDEEFAATERLTRLIVTRTGLPLRDLAPLMAELARTKNTFKALGAAALPDAVKAPLMVPRRRLRRLLWIILLLLASMALLTGGPLLAQSRAQAAQQDYITGLAPRVLAQTPLYQDALTSDDGQWPVERTGASNDGMRRTFAGGAYTLSGQPGQAVVALGPAQSGDAAIAVTVHQLSAGSGDTGLGLVLRASADQRNMLVFYIYSTDDTWTFAHYMTNTPPYNPYNPSQSNAAWEYKYGAASAAIHRGKGATNQLLVLARGPVYLLYINGTLVDSESSDRYGPQQVLASGYAGVYLDDGVNAGAYTDFAVYPVQSSPSLSYV